jgi:AbiV family abortive infection protein
MGHAALRERWEPQGEYNKDDNFHVESIGRSNRMSDLEVLNKSIQACVKNADEHIAAARELRKTDHNNMAFNAAVLALEEIGKAVLIGMNRGHAANYDPGFVRADWFEDHAKKLFWALWSSSFGRSADPAQDFQDFPHIASRIHRQRLNAIYVEPDAVELPERITDDEVDAIIRLAEYRAEKERHVFLQELDAKDRPDLDWFMRAGDDPKLAGVVFSKESFARLQSFGGDVREWVRWLRTEITRLEDYNQRLAEEELNRISPSGDHALNPKWSLKIRLHSWSHSIHPKLLTSWNKKSQFIKLSAPKGRRELLVQFLVPEKVMLRDLWNTGHAISNSFALAVNVATRGFFWWYLPARTTKFFEEIRDMGRNVPLTADSPSLTVSWGDHSLTEGDLEETLRVYMYLSRLPKERWEPYLTYLQGLALVAKNDIHGRFEPTILQLFYQAFRGCAIQRGDWDGSSPFLDAAKRALEVFRDRMDSIDRELPRQVQLGEMLLRGTLVQDLTIRDAILMKLFCDLCISRSAHEALGFQIVQPEHPGSAAG